ncbi:MAG TPA: methionine synthase, partial [Clostridiales bacterium UBA8153]|nr:methionine synthase [Clostridiales bacterium UBA8153]
PLLYDRCAMELLATQLRQLARGQERKLQELAARAWPGQDLGTLVFVDEPYLVSYGSAYFTLGREEVIAYINWVMDGLHGLKGVHCCGNTDWSILLATSVDVLSFDAHAYGDALMLYAREVAEFLGRGGYLAWGIVPSQGDAARKETVDALTGRLLEQAGKLARHGLSLEHVLERSWVTPACGLGGQTQEDAEYIAGLTFRVSTEIIRLTKEGSGT